jgi:hypothetical protein
MGLLVSNNVTRIENQVFASRGRTKWGDDKHIWVPTLSLNERGSKQLSKWGLVFLRDIVPPEGGMGKKETSNFIYMYIYIIFRITVQGEFLESGIPTSEQNGVRERS